MVRDHIRGSAGEHVHHFSHSVPADLLEFTTGTASKSGRPRCPAARCRVKVEGHTVPSAGGSGKSGVHNGGIGITCVRILRWLAGYPHRR
jgi:hypothetical protein